MGAADQRMAELLDRWQESVELHAKYLALDDAAYAEVQDWPPHQRPTRWVVELARTRLLELKRLLAERRERGDHAFAEALELAGFLTNLLGSQHVERFVPLAQAPARARPELPPSAAPVAHGIETATPSRAATPAPPRRAEPVRTGPRPAVAGRTTRSAVPATRRPSAAQSTAAPAKQPAQPANDKTTATVITDAVRLISWGREWPQLAGLIARLADRPPEADVWKILRRYRAEIEAQARRPRD
jgi:hypothetical protein